MNIFLANSFLAERLTASTKREFLSITTLFWTSAEKLSLIHPSAALLAKHMSSQQHLAHHHAVSARVSPFSVDSVQPTTLPNHFDLSSFSFPNWLGLRPASRICTRPHLRVNGALPLFILLGIGIHLMKWAVSILSL
jgi:hypothetical protein